MRGMRIDADFPGGNVLVEKVEGDLVYLRPDPRDTEGPWFYWYFRVRGGAGRDVTFHFTQANCVGARGPAVSWDGGRNWRWLGAAGSDDFTCRIPEGVEDARFSVTIPYTQAHWEAFLAGPRLTAAGLKEVGTLCRTPRGRAVETLRLKTLAEPRHRVIITARHHACESMGSYTLEGLVTEILNLGSPRARTEFLIIPFMDKDGVEQGDQGKNRAPRDHNRDYDGVSHWAETRALRQLLPEWGAGRLAVALDLHCPWIKGGLNEKAYFVGQPDLAIWRAQQALFSQVEAAAKGPIPFVAADGLPFGVDWNVGDSFTRGMTFIGFAVTQPGIQCAATLEIPYANARGAEVNPESARLLGKDIARGLAAYLADL
jgi:hypothetical protein